MIASKERVSRGMGGGGVIRNVSMETVIGCVCFCFQKPVNSKQVWPECHITAATTSGQYSAVRPLRSVSKRLIFNKGIFNKRLVSSTHIFQGIFSTWNKAKLCSPGTTKIFLPGRKSARCLLKLSITCFVLSSVTEMRALYLSSVFPTLRYMLMTTFTILASCFARPC